MKVIEMFSSIDGEGVRTGKPVLFIRLAGCNLRCTYCDTKYSYENPIFEELSVDFIVDHTIATGLKLVTLTGGEPLIHKECELLINKLCAAGIEVNVETNGSIDIAEFHKKNIEHTNVFYTIDFKSIASGMTHKMNYNNMEAWKSVDCCLKFVVGSKNDLDQMAKLVEHFKPKCEVFVSPEFGKIEPVEIVEYIMERPSLFNCRVQVQLHKIIWEPNERGV